MRAITAGAVLAMTVAATATAGPQRSVTVLLGPTVQTADPQPRVERFLGRLLLDLHSGDRLSVYIPALAEGTGTPLDVLLATRFHRRPAIRSRQRLAVHRIVNRWVSSPAPAVEMPDLQATVPAALHDVPTGGNRELVIMGNITGQEPPKAADLRDWRAGGVQVLAVDFGVHGRETGERDRVLAGWEEAIEATGARWRALPLVPARPAEGGGRNGGDPQ